MLKTQNHTLPRGAAVCLFLFSASLQAQSLKLPDGHGKETTQKVCGACHAAEFVLGRQESRDGWGAVVQDMIQRGATGTDEEFYDVVEYLATNFSKDSPAIKINVNKASAQDLQNTLQLPEKQALAIVQEREKGSFKSIDDLKKIPGIDAKKIDASKNRLEF